MTPQRTLLLIPCRLASTRIPRKPLVPLNPSTDYPGDVTTPLRRVINSAVQTHYDVRVSWVEPELADYIRDLEKTTWLGDRFSSSQRSGYTPEQRIEDILADEVPLLAEAYDRIGVLNPTSVFLSPSSIIGCMEMLWNPHWDTVCTVVRQQEFILDAYGRPVNFDLPQLKPSQELEPQYIVTTGLIGFRTSQWLHRRTQWGRDIGMYEVDAIEGIDINFPADLDLVQRVNRGVSAWPT